MKAIVALTDIFVVPFLFYRLIAEIRDAIRSRRHRTNTKEAS